MTIASKNKQEALIKSLLAGFKDIPTNGWFKFESARVYMRVTKRLLDVDLNYCVDIATIVIDNPKLRQKGTFTRLLALVKSELIHKEENWYIYIENVMDRPFGEALERRKFKKIGFGYSDPYLQSFYIAAKDLSTS